MFINLLIPALMIVAMWFIFAKANKPGWAALIPFYNLLILIEIVKKPWWWVLLLALVPIANIVIWVLINIELAKKFGKETGFAIGLIFLPVIFMPILAFSDAKYSDDENQTA